MLVLVNILDLCIVLKANKYRLYPSDWQKELLDKHFGSVRFVFNLALETKTWAYSAHKTNLSRYDLQVQLKDLKEDCTWLREVLIASLYRPLYLTLIWHTPTFSKDVVSFLYFTRDKLVTFYYQRIGTLMKVKI